MRTLLAILLLGAVGGCAPRAEAPVSDAGHATAGADTAVAGTPAIRPATADQVLAAVREPGAKAVLVNVWASWCGPCREEFPDLVRLERDYKDRGLRVVYVSTDVEVGDARTFLRGQGVRSPSFIMTGKDMEFINGLSPKWTGALPATFVYDGAGHLLHVHEGKTTYARWEQLITDAFVTTETPSHKEIPS